VHDRISSRLARFITEGGPEVVAQAPDWKVPTLLLYAGEDRLVDPAGSHAFADAAPPDVVASRCFDQLYHEIFNEHESQQVFDSLQHWLDKRF
jgi:alpha-beta hydrolase superfamily lysophospholipase